MKTESFNGKTAVIIGGTSGIGKATAKMLLQNGAKVHVISKDQNSVNNATKELKAFGNVSGHKVNISAVMEVNNLISKINRDLGKIDYLVNASGIFGPKPFLDYTREDYDSYLDLNRGFFFITQAVANTMKAN